MMGRRNLLATIINTSNYSIANIEPELHEYEKILREAVIAGFTLDVRETDVFPGRFHEKLEKWTLLKAVFFSSTVLTTIGRQIKSPVKNSACALKNVVNLCF